MSLGVWLSGYYTTTLIRFVVELINIFDVAFIRNTVIIYEPINHQSNLL